MKGVESVIKLLAALFLATFIGCFFAEWWFHSDQVFFTSISGMASTILGALMLKITGREHHVSPEPAAPTIVPDPVEPKA